MQRYRKPWEAAYEEKGRRVRVIYKNQPGREKRNVKIQIEEVTVGASAKKPMVV